MKHSKDFYRTISFNGYTWRGFIDNLHFFAKPYNSGSLCVTIAESDIEDGSVEFMLTNDISR